MVEFAMVVGAFLLILFAAVSAAFHAIQRAMAETAAAAGVQVAASADPNDQAQPYLAGAYGATAPLLRTVMFGTSVVPGPPGQQCAPAGSNGPGVLEVCAWIDPARPDMVGETVRGTPAFLIPFLANRIPWDIDVTLETHRVGYRA